MKLKKIIMLAACAAFFAMAGCAAPAKTKEEIKLKEMSFNATELVMGVGDTFQLELTLDPVDATKGRVVTLYSMNADKADVSETFLVTAKEVGETEIVAASSYGGIETRVKVAIVPKLAAGMDLLVALRGAGETVYLTNDVTITADDLAFIQNERLLIKKPKTIRGGGFTLDLSGIAVSEGKGVMEIVTDEAVVLDNLTVLVPSAFAGKEEQAITDPYGALQKNNCTIKAK